MATVKAKAEITMFNVKDVKGDALMGNTRTHPEHDG